MQIAIECPKCEVTVKAPASAVGKRVKCPKCSSSILVPAPEDEDPGFEVVEDAPVVSKAKSAKARPIETEDEDDRPRKRKRQDDMDEEDEDQPRKRGSKKPVKKSGGLPLWIPIAGGAAFMVVLGVVGLVLLLGGKSGGGGLFGGPPQGYTAINDSGIKIHLYGNISSHIVKHNGVPDPNMVLSTDQMQFAQERDHRCVLFAHRQPGFKPNPPRKGSASNIYKSSVFVEKVLHFTVVSEEEITLGGQPALKTILKEAPFLMGDTAEQKEFFKNHNDREQQRIAREGKVIAFLHVVNGEWSYYITVTNRLNDIDPKILKTIIDSVRF